MQQGWVSELIIGTQSDFTFRAWFLQTIGKGNKQRIIPPVKKQQTGIKNYLEYARPALEDEKKLSNVLFLNLPRRSVYASWALEEFKENRSDGLGYKEVSPRIHCVIPPSHILEAGV